MPASRKKAMEEFRQKSNSNLIKHLNLIISKNINLKVSIPPSSPQPILDC